MGFGPGYSWFSGADTLLGEVEVAISCVFGWEEVFLDQSGGEAWPSHIVALSDCIDPCDFDWVPR